MTKRRTYQKRGQTENSKPQSQQRIQSRTPSEHSSVRQNRMQPGGTTESHVNLWDGLQAELKKKEQQQLRQPPRPGTKAEPQKNQATGSKKLNQAKSRPWPGMPTESQQKKARPRSQGGVQSGQRGQRQSGMERPKSRTMTGRTAVTQSGMSAESQQRGALQPKPHHPQKQKKRKHYRVKTRFKVLMVTLCVAIVASFNYVLSPLVGSNSETEPSNAQPTAVQPPVGTRTQQSTAGQQNASTKVDKSSEYLKLVNKTHAVESREEPDDLVQLKTGTKEGVTTEHDQLRRVPAKYFVQLVKGGKAQGLEFVATSAYRPYAYQKSLHERYAAKDGAVKANTYSAKPGYSEHETGLCLDVSSPSVNYSLTEAYGTTTEGKWLANNAHKYGFIIRYPKGKEKITGYDYEPWHLRYVGKAAAKEIYEKEITLEEYLGEV